uniref:Uncharacterized protein n=1 Tax=Geladintestivirus 1 TaxID=3233133 RepID=A0AAU8MJK3_9CAUD
MSNTGIKQIATTYREYYKLFHQEMLQSAKTLHNQCEKLSNEVNNLKKVIIENKDIYYKIFHIDIDKYINNIEDKNIFKEFIKKVTSSYIVCKKTNENYLTICIAYNLCQKHKELKELYRKLQTVEYCANIKLNDYKEYLKRYFTEVHKELILNGNAYMISSIIGTICFNRCKLENAKPKLDWKATKLRKEELIKEGKTLWDEESAQFAKANGLDYDGVDYRVYMNKDYVYEIPLLFGKFKNAQSSNFIPSDYRARSVRGKTNEELIKECNNDLNKIVELPVDVKTKLTMCVSIDNIIQTKFIRNENQEPITTPKAYRKNR